MVDAVRRKPEKPRWDAAWTLLVTAVQTGPPDLVVVPATTLVTLRRDGWEVPTGIDQLAGVVSVSLAADHAADRVATQACR